MMFDERNLCIEQSFRVVSLSNEEDLYNLQVIHESHNNQPLVSSDRQCFSHKSGCVSTSILLLARLMLTILVFICCVSAFTRLTWLSKLFNFAVFMRHWEMAWAGGLPRVISSISFGYASYYFHLYEASKLETILSHYFLIPFLVPGIFRSVFPLAEWKMFSNIIDNNWRRRLVFLYFWTWQEFT